MQSELGWYYNDKEFTEDDIGDYLGFVYRITELSTGRFYLGKKIFWNRVAKPPLKGKKRRRISRKASDWKDYYGSGPEIKKLVEQNGKAAYKREILRLCSTKSEMGYYESKLIFETDALLRDDSINEWISCRITKGQLNAIRGKAI